MRGTRVNQSQVISVNTRSGTISILRTIVLPLLLLTGSVVLWVLALPQIDPSQMNDLGLVSVLPVTYFAALGILAISYILALNQEGSHDFILFLHLLTLIFILHGTPQIVYGTLRYSWAWKHVGIVDYIQRNGSVNPTIAYLNAYHNWPGFFALMAMYNVVAGFQSSLSYAGWAPVFFNLLDLGPLLIIFKSLTADRRLVWLSVWFFYMFSWVGQDYFSPQAIAYFLYLAVIAILLKWFRESQMHARVGSKSHSITQQITSLYHTLVDHAAQDNQQTVPTNPLQRIFIMSVLVLVFLAIASSHQLTPLMMVSVLILLVLFQVTNQRFLPILMATFTAVWLIFMAIGFLDGNLHWIISSIGSLLDNVNGNLINLARTSPGQQVIAKTDRIMSASVWVLAVLGVFRRLRAGKWDVIAMLLAIAPIPILALNSYGGEMLFRVYFFSLPGVVFLAACLIYPREQAQTPIKTQVFVTAITLMLIPGFLFSYYGKERMYYFSPNEIAAANYVFTTAPKGALIVDGIWDWPRQYTHYEDYNYLSLLLLTQQERTDIMKDPIGKLSEYLHTAAPGAVYVNQTATNPGVYPAAYIVITRSQVVEAEMTGTLPGDWSTSIIHSLTQSTKFQIVFSDADAVVIKYIATSGKN